MAKILAFTKGSERRRLLRAGMKALRPKRVGIVKKVHGVKVYMKYPPKYANAVPVNVNYKSNSNKSNRSQMSNYASNGNNGNRMRFVNFQNLRAKSNKAVKAKPGSRFAKKFAKRSVLNFKRVNRAMKPTRKYSYLPVSKSTNNKTARLPTQSRRYAGSRAAMSRAQLRAANNARWKKYEKMMKNNPTLSPNKRSELANRLMQEALKNVREGKINLPVMKRRDPSSKNILRSIGLGSASSSAESNNGMSLEKPKARRVKERLERKIRSMARRKMPQVNIAEEFERSMLKGPQGEKVSLRKTANERSRIKELQNKLEKFVSSNSGSSSASPSKRMSPAKAKKSTGIKSLRKK
jgi:hypothetical protein